MSARSRDDRLRVLHVVHTYHPVVGGSELAFRKIGEGLATRGVDVSVFTSTARSAGDFVAPGAETLPAGPEEVNGVHVHRLAFRRLPPRPRHAASSLSHVWSTHRLPGYGMAKVLWVGPHLQGLVGDTIRLAPDVVAATCAPFMPMFRAAAAARRIRRPVALMPCLHPGDRWLIDNPSLIRLLRSADAIMALTAYEMRFLRALGVDADRIFLIGGGVDPNAAERAEPGLRPRFRIPEGDPIVLFCGRKEEGKGILDLLDAIVRLWQQGTAATLVLAGGSTEYSRGYLARMIARLPPEWKANLVVRDDITEEEKWGWYQEAAVLAHPSRIESFGLVYLEAWLCGKPVIAGRTGPQAAVVTDGRDGLLVRPGDAEELSGALKRILGDREFGTALGRRGQAKVLSEFTWDVVVERAARMYHHLAGANGR